MPPAGVSSDLLARLAAEAGRLYSLPAVATEVLRLTEQPRVDVAALRACLENDPGLTARLLRVVNSSLFGLSRPVGDLSQALTLLGIEPLKLLVLGFSLPENMFGGLEREVLRDYWTRALIEALAAREIAGLVSPAHREEAFLAGLLHDLGTMVMVQQLGRPYLELLEQSRRAGHDPRQAEGALLGFDRIALSARLLTDWRLPGAIARGVELSRNEPPAGEPLAAILHLAHLLADCLTGAAEQWDDLRLAAGRLTGLDQYDLAGIMSAVELRLPQLAEALGLAVDSREEGSSERLEAAELQSRAHRRLAELAERAAIALARGEAPGSPPITEETESSLLRAVEELAAVARAGDRLSAPPSEVEPAAPLVLERRGRAASASPRAAAPQPPREEPVFGAELARRLERQLAFCRRDRAPLSLVLLGIDHFESLLLRGPQAAEAAAGRLAEGLRRGLEPRETLVACGDGCFALLLPGRSRPEVVSLVRRWIEAVGRQSGPLPISLSAGVAWTMPPPVRFPAERLLEAAQRCLSGARLSGGGVKSIDVM